MSKSAILFANNYDTIGARLGVSLGVYPDHHLFGMTSAPAGNSIVDLHATEGFRSAWGDRGLQLEAIRRGPGILFAANQTSVRGLMAARAAGLHRSPIVAVVHDVPGMRSGVAARRVHRAIIGGADRIITMCQSTRAGLITGLGVEPSRITVGPWGPDATFEPFLAASTAPDGPVVSMGKSNRDIETALRALALVGRPARVYVRDREHLVASPHVQLVDAFPPRRLPHEPSSYQYVMDDLAKASLVLIPLRPGAVALQGLTELNDALACGKPIVMTRMPYIDIDIEAEGVGLWVEPGDWRGMAESVSAILDDTELHASMGRRARELVQTRWNSAAFRACVWDVIASLQ